MNSLIQRPTFLKILHLFLITSSNFASVLGTCLMIKRIITSIIMLNQIERNIAEDSIIKDIRNLFSYKREKTMALKVEY